MANLIYLLQPHHTPQTKPTISFAHRHDDAEEFAHAAAAAAVWPECFGKLIKTNRTEPESESGIELN